MKTTVDIDDGLLIQARVLSARERKSLAALIEEGLRLRLRVRRHEEVHLRLTLPIYRGKSGLAEGVDSTSNRSLFDAARDDA